MPRAVITNFWFWIDFKVGIPNIKIFQNVFFLTKANNKFHTNFSFNVVNLNDNKLFDFFFMDKTPCIVTRGTRVWHGTKIVTFVYIESEQKSRSLNWYNTQPTLCWRTKYIILLHTFPYIKLHENVTTPSALCKCYTL